ncbi:hypothetical protein [Pseudomonas protegens]|uniref:hypothetical protein n=1 Tax=Pseudomonas protegens TaxID=380021 RepID=UPI00098D4050|nr:hypothetical protein [Pseudomonas protegens]GED77820.1 hypothetical protein PFL02_46700 [Pseudomonas fluorescens]AQT10777.1 hypothetical protein H78_04119 [Pseudomonas protegens]MBP5097297.1 hypothetical protein [Pseudomonas protegens]MBP5102992.1 hypothetical protein [Pseudomonas protegens]MBP5126855.1 hypothetical protein [Pseudomonas protegens]
MTDQLCLVFVPALVALLLNAENTKGMPLTEAEVLEIRDNAACVALPVAVALSMENQRGYRDLVAENCWEQWQQFRSEAQA